VAIFDQLEEVATVLRRYNTELKEKKLSKWDLNALKYKL
jgi:hypothetical protein